MNEHNPAKKVTQTQTIFVEIFMLTKYPIKNLRNLVTLLYV